MDPFSRLPAPLPLLILEHLEQFTDLQMVTLATPDADHLFMANAVRILHSVAQSTLHLHITVYLEVLVKIWSGELQVPEGTKDGVSFRQPSHLVEAHLDMNKISDPDRIGARMKEGITPHMARRLLTCAANIERLALAIVDDGVERLRAAPIMQKVEKPTSGPVYFDIFDLKYIPGERPGTCSRENWPQGTVRDRHGPAAFDVRPSWMESFRLRRALWVLLIILESRRADESLYKAPPPWQPDYLGANSSPYELHLAGVSREAITAARCVQYVGPKVDPTWDYTFRPSPSLDDAYMFFFVELPNRLPTCEVKPLGAPVVFRRPRYLGLPPWTAARGGKWLDQSRSGFEMDSHMLLDRRVLRGGVPYFPDGALQMANGYKYGLRIWDSTRRYDLGLSTNAADERPACGEEKEEEVEQPSRSRPPVPFETVMYSLASILIP